VVLTIAKSEDNLVNRFSTFQRLIRVTATCIRFTQLCKRKNKTIASHPLTMKELEHARKCIIKMEQLAAFRAEIWSLRENRVIPSDSSLRQLNPLLDRDGLLRVGGRLRYAELPYNTKHPLVLSHHSKLTDLIVLHIRHFHAGADATLTAHSERKVDFFGQIRLQISILNKSQ